jgi:hypothetical protein
MILVYTGSEDRGLNNPLSVFLEDLLLHDSVY